MIWRCRIIFPCRKIILPRQEIIHQCRKTIFKHRKIMRWHRKTLSRHPPIIRRCRKSVLPRQRLILPHRKTAPPCGPGLLPHLPAMRRPCGEGLPRAIATPPSPKTACPRHRREAAPLGRHHPLHRHPPPRMTQTSAGETPPTTSSPAIRASCPIPRPRPSQPSNPNARPCPNPITSNPTTTPLVPS